MQFDGVKQCVESFEESLVDDIVRLSVNIKSLENEGLNADSNNLLLLTRKGSEHDLKRKAIA